MKRKIYGAIVLILLCSCKTGQNNNNKEILLHEENYIIPDSLLDFFPMQSESIKPMLFVDNAGNTDLPYFKTEFEITYVVKIYEYADTSQFKLNTKKALNSSVSQYFSNDTNYFIIGSESDILERYDTLTLKDKYNSVKNNALVLSFHNILNDNKEYYCKTTICGLPNDYSILILKNGNQYILPAKYKTEWNILPAIFRHGYSSGIAYSQTHRYIVYWVVAW